MNFSTSNNQQSNHPTPVSQEPPNDPPSISFEQYQPAIGNSYFAQHFATLRINPNVQEQEDPPEVPPLPKSPNLLDDQVLISESPINYRSLQSTPAASPKSKMMNFSNYFPKVVTDPPNRKRYYTQPREKQRVSTFFQVY